MMQVPRASGLVLAVLVFASAPAARAQFDFDSSQRANTAYLDISIEAATHLRTAASYVADRNWPEALDLYERLIQNFPHKVVQVGTSPLYVSVRDYCHMQIAALPPEARAIYRKRVDPQAALWFRQGVTERDGESLARVVDRALCSSWGDDALDALAELAFEAGRFEEAHGLWQRIGTGIERPADANRAHAATRFSYPDSDLDPALVEAKKFLCLLFSGKTELAERGLIEFRRRFPAARGKLGGVDAPLADQLGAIVKDAGAPADAYDGVWLTFGGNPQRSKLLRREIEVGSKRWGAPLPQSTIARSTARPGGPMGPSEDSLSHHPILVRDWVIVCGREEVWAYDLYDGPKERTKPTWAYQLRDTQGASGIPLAPRPATGSPHFTLTADGDRLFVRLGAPETAMTRRGMLPDSHLVCLDLRGEGREVWRIQPDEADLAFEGSPIAADGNVYIGVTRGGAMTHAFVACYDAATGAKKWRQLICEASSGGGFWGQASISHNLLTIGAGMLFYNTNLGAIAALDQRSGRVRWVATYPREDVTGVFGRDIWGRGNVESSPPRELSPCVYHEGTLVVLPTDGRALFAFDALTGELRWKRSNQSNQSNQPLIRHVLGVAHGKVICTGGYVQALDIETGRPAWPQWPDGAPLQAFGRGVLAGDYVYFPTKSHIHRINVRTGMPEKDSIALQEKHEQSPGNLVIGDGHVVIAQAKSIAVFCQYDLLKNRYRDVIAAKPADPAPRFRLARAAEASGDYELALEQYRAAIERVRPGDTVEGRDLKHAAQSKLHALLAEMAKQSIAAEQWAKADRFYRDAAAAAPSDQARLNSLLSIGELWIAAGDAGRALAAYQELLGADSLRGLAVAVDSGRSVRADVELAGRVQSLIERFGRDLYKPFDAAAERLFELAKRDDEPALIDRLIRAYPNARVVSESLLFQANHYATANQLVPAAAAFKQLTARADLVPEIEVAAWEGFARVQEAQRYWRAARASWQHLVQRFPDAALASRPDRAVASFVAERLSKPPFSGGEINGDGSSTDALRLPLARRWNRQWPEGARVVIPGGSPPADQGMLILLADSKSVSALAAESGDTVWRRELAGPARWAVFHDDRLLVATDSQVVSIHAARGELIWRQTAQSGEAVAPPAESKAGADPSRPAPGPPLSDEVIAMLKRRIADRNLPGNMRAEMQAMLDRAIGDRPPAASAGASAANARAAANFSEFRLVEDRLYLRDGDQRLVCLAADSGELLWSYSPTEGSILPNPFISPQHVVLRTKLPGKFVVLDGDGRRRFEFAPPGQTAAHAPAAVDAHRICVAGDDRRIQLIDLRDGKATWEFQLPPSDRPPQPIAGSGSLFVLVGGVDLERRDPETGRRLWTRRISDDPLPNSPGTFAIDGSRFFCVTSEQNLRSFQLDDGELVWQQSLIGPGSEWQLIPSGNYVIALPRKPHATDGLPVVICRQSDGRLVQRPMFRPRGSEAIAHVGPHGALFGSERELWALGNE